MRIIWALVFAALLTTAAQAQRVTIRTGEHDGFTRLVLTLPQPGDWRVTRAENGYAVAVGTGRPDYDLSDVFRLIPRTRLAAIRTDPADGRLRLDIGCRCHAWAVELRRGLLVIDLRDGPPPPTSPYELDDLGNRMAAVRDRNARSPRPAGATGIRPATADRPQVYDWRTAAIARARDSTPYPAEPRQIEGQPMTLSLEPVARPAARDWRETLINELGRGATRGVVDLAPAPAMPKNSAGAAMPWPQVRIGDGPLPAGTADDPDPGLMTAAGDSCIPDEALDLSAWGDPGPVAQVIGPMTRNLMGEFDRLETAATERAAQYMLYLGFGAEARQLLVLAGQDLPEAGVLGALSHILDGTVPPADYPALAGMTGCDTAAALWSLLALPSGLASVRLNENAVLRAFSALPLHLRRYLGPEVADGLLSAGKTEAARAVRDAILRAPGDAGAAVMLMSLGIDQSAGASLSESNLAPLRGAPGPTGLQATILSLEADLAADRTTAPAVLTAAEALLREYRGTQDAADLSRALAAAQAAAGDLRRAFELADGRDEAEAGVWAILAKTGGDAALLEYGLRAAADLPGGLSPETDRAMARRLLTLGFPREAMAWIAPARRRSGLQDHEDRMLMAEALLADRDARKAAAVLGGIDTPAAEALRARALLLLNASTPDGPPQDQAIIARRTARWDIVAATGEGVWRNAAALIPAPMVVDGGPMAQGRALQEESATARATIAGLLEASRLREAP
jgi:hypothetical protein